MKKLLLISIATILFLNIFGSTIVFAQTAGTLLPDTTRYSTDCVTYLDNLFIGKNKDGKWEITKPDGTKEFTTEIGKHFAQQDSQTKNDILACGIMTGKISFWMVPYYIVYFIEFAIGISGLIAIGFLVLGGFKYVTSGADSNENAKNTIKWALIGLVVVLSAWVLVNLVQFVVTI